MKIQASRLDKLVREGQRLWDTEKMEQWQIDRINEIRQLGEKKCAIIDQKADEAKRGIVEEFMQFEIDFIYGSQKFKKENPGEEMKLTKDSGGKLKELWDKIISYGKN